MKRQEIELSGDFKDLFFKMISIKPEKRPNINDILKHAWFKEIDDMKINDPEKFNALNKEISDIFSSLSESVKKYNQKEMEANEKESEKKQDRSSLDNTYFNPNLRPQYLDTPLKANNCINIKGYLDPVEFMNELCEKYGLPTDTEVAFADMAQAAMGDKKTAGSKINLVMLKQIGESFITPLPLDELESFITI